MVFERLAPFVEMERFDMLPRANILRSHLWRVDLHAPWRARPLLADTRPGTIIYGFSTDGSRLAIGRFAKETWQLGIVTMNKGTVRWFDLSPDYSPFYTTLRWLPGNRLVMIAMPEGKRPAWLLADSLPADRLPDHWKATRSGVVPAVTVIGSGRFRAVNARPPANRLVLLDAASGTLHELASGQFLSLTVAPDSKRVALLEMGATAPMPEDRPAGQIDGPFSRTTAIYDFQGRSLWRPCSDCDVLGAPVWSPGSEKLLFFARRTGEDWPRAALFALDMSARNIERLHNERFVPAISEFPDGPRAPPSVGAQASRSCSDGSQIGRSSPGMVCPAPSEVARDTDCETAVRHARYQQDAPLRDGHVERKRRLVPRPSEAVATGWRGRIFHQWNNSARRATSRPHLPELFVQSCVKGQSPIGSNRSMRPVAGLSLSAR
jgi:hypothetical protein